MSNLTELPNIERDKLAAQIEELKRKLPLLLEMANITAKMRHTAFEAYKREGFTEEQALLLCRQ